jgi:hypothetical protein
MELYTNIECLNDHIAMLNGKMSNQNIRTWIDYVIINSQIFAKLKQATTQGFILDTWWEFKPTLDFLHSLS